MIMSTFWSCWIVVLTLTNLVLLFWILMANRRRAVVANENDTGEAKTTGHVYDGIEEYDNPLPKWWFGLFLATFIFTAGYLVAYPGLGLWKGMLGWTSHNQLEGEQTKAQATYDSTFGEFAKTPIDQLAKNPEAMKMGSRLFLNNCAVCHGSDAGGFFGFPNLTDKDWLYGGSPERIKETITLGRQALMPAWGPIIGEANVSNVVEFVLKRAGKEHDEAKAALGETVFSTNCAACHGADGKGNQQVGAPNLTDDVWLYGAATPEELPAVLRQTVRNGRGGVMPTHAQTLKAERIHLLAAYVYSLSLDDAK
ncbi:Cbb3-type cytochrome c oxidase subunit [Cellvibrio zantedeschiae]|uniref:Cbb3-type cytochrome c oxidase subunit n=2 Tax=Cellvibrio zantedeschiae TaxID=1237077 RepID=A0ABQ3APJ8_9GAMM|nr:Cbb3-type cytochrome c oxidase subunit [Cellvibrio zantedeschiae]